MPKDLRTYLDELLEKRPKDVVVVDKEVDPRYEASAIVEKFERENKFPLVFFKNIKARKFRWSSISARPTNGWPCPWVRPLCRRWSKTWRTASIIRSR